MLQRGVVTATNDELAQVSFERSEACAKCRACSMGKKEQVTITVVNNCGAKIGDMVDVELHGEKVAKASALVYIFPLGALLLGLLGAPKIYSPQIPLPQDIFACLVALILTAMTFLAIRLTEKKRAASGEFAPVMDSLAVKVADVAAIIPKDSEEMGNITMSRNALNDIEQEKEKD